MSIANYGDLKTAVANWTARADLTDRIPEFIASALQRINNDLMLLGGIPDQEQVATTTTVANQESYALPDDFASMRWIRRDYSTSADVRPLEQRAYSDIVERYGTVTGAPEAFDIVDASFYLGPIPDGVYTLRLAYIKRYTAFSADADTNYLLTSGNNIVLWASLIEAFAFIADPQRMQDSLAGYRESLNGLRLAARRARNSGAPLQSGTWMFSDNSTGNIINGL